MLFYQIFSFSFSFSDGAEVESGQACPCGAGGGMGALLGAGRALAGRLAAWRRALRRLVTCSQPAEEVEEEVRHHLLSGAAPQAAAAAAQRGSGETRSSRRARSVTRSCKATAKPATIDGMLTHDSSHIIKLQLICITYLLLCQKLR